MKNDCSWISVTFEHEGNFYIANLNIYYIAIVNATEPENASNIETFDDIRKIQKHLKKGGLTLTSEADEKTQGPASLMLTDPDGNAILLDQHR